MAYYENEMRYAPSPVATFTIPHTNPMSSRRRQAPPPPLSSITQIESIQDLTSRNGPEVRNVRREDSYERLYAYAGSPPPNKLSYERKELPTPPPGPATPDPAASRAPRQKKSKDFNILIQETGGKIISEGMEKVKNHETGTVGSSGRKKKSSRGRNSRQESRDFTADSDASYDEPSVRISESRRQKRDIERGKQRRGGRGNENEAPQGSSAPPKQSIGQEEANGKAAFPVRSSSLRGFHHGPQRKQTPFRQPRAEQAPAPPPPELPPLSPLPNTAYAPFEPQSEYQKPPVKLAAAPPPTNPAYMRPSEEQNSFKLAPAPSQRSPVKKKKNVQKSNPKLKSHSSNLSTTSIDIPFFIADNNVTPSSTSGSSRIPSAIVEDAEDHLQIKGSPASTKPAPLRVTNRPTPINLAEHRHAGPSRDQDVTAQLDNDLIMELALELEVHENSNGDIHLLPSPRNLSPRAQNSPMSNFAFSNSNSSPNSLNVPSPYGPPQMASSSYDRVTAKHKRSDSLESASSDSTSSSVLRDMGIGETGRRNKPMVDTPLTDYSGMMTPASFPASATGSKFKMSRQPHLQVKSPITDLRPISACSNGSIFDSYYGDFGNGGEVNMSLKLSEDDRRMTEMGEEHDANPEEWTEGDNRNTNTGVSEWQMEWDRITQGQRSSGSKDRRESALDLQLTPPGIFRPQKSIDVFSSPTETPRWALEDELKREMESETQRFGNLAGFNSSANVSQKPAIDEWLMRYEPMTPMTPMTPVELGIGRLGVVVDRRGARTEEERKVVDEKRITAWPSLTIVEEEEDVPSVTIGNLHESYTGPPVPPPPPPPPSNAYTGPPVPAAPVSPPPPFNAYTGPPVPPTSPQPRAVSPMTAANPHRIQRSATAPIRQGNDTSKLSRSKTIKELIFTRGRSTPYGEESISPTSGSPAMTVDSRFRAQSPPNVTNIIINSPRDDATGRASPSPAFLSPAFPSPALSSPGSPSPSVLFSRSSSLRKQSITKEDISRPMILGTEYGSVRSLASIKENNPPRSMSTSPEDNTHTRTASIGGGSLRSIQPHMISLPLTPGTPGSFRTMHTNDSYSILTSNVLTPMTPHSPPFTQSIKSPVSESAPTPASASHHYSGPPVPPPPPPPPPPSDPSQIPVAQAVPTEEMTYPRPLEVHPPKAHTEEPPAPPVPLKRFASLSLRRTLSLGFKSSRAPGNVSRSPSTASTTMAPARGRFKPQLEPQPQILNASSPTSPAFAKPGHLREDGGVTLHDDADSKAAELERRRKERKVAPGTLVIRPNIGEPVSLKNGKDIGHRLKPRRVDDKLLSAPKKAGESERGGSCNACKRGPFPTMWICADTFYDDEENDGCAHNDSMRIHEPGTGRSFCKFCLCRMCANEKIGSGVGSLD